MLPVQLLTRAPGLFSDLNFLPLSPPCLLLGDRVFLEKRGEVFRIEAQPAEGQMPSTAHAEASCGQAPWRYFQSLVLSTRESPNPRTGVPLAGPHHKHALAVSMHSVGALALQDVRPQPPSAPTAETKGGSRLVSSKDSGQRGGASETLWSHIVLHSQAQARKEQAPLWVSDEGPLPPLHTSPRSQAP